MARGEWRVINGGNGSVVAGPAQANLIRYEP